MLYTAVDADARELMADLSAAGHVPPSLLPRLESVDWSGEHEDLAFVPRVSPEDVRLVDDDAGWVRPDQRDQWVPIAGWDGGPDAGELPRVRAVLDRWARGRRHGPAEPLR